MMNHYGRRIARYLKLVGLAAAAGLVAGLAVYVAHSLLVRKHPNATQAFYGAFFAAILAFGSLLIGLAVRRTYQRFLRNYDGLVRLQHYLNDAIDRIGDNLHEVGHFVRTFKSATSESDVTILANRFVPIPTYPEVLLDLLNLDLINELFQFNTDVRKANDHLAMLNRTHDSVQAGVAGGVIDPERYKWNLQSMVDEVRKLEDRLKDRDVDARRLFATVRLLSQHKPVLVRIRRELEQSSYPAGFDEKLRKQLRELDAEIERNKSRRDRRVAELNSLSE